MIDWISIHGYWDPLWQNENLSGYDKVMQQICTIDDQIKQAESYINIFGYSDKIKIAFDEWNLRGCITRISTQALAILPTNT